MVVAEEQDLVAGFEIEAARDSVVRFAGVAGDDDLFRCHAQKRGDRAPRGFAAVVRLLPVL
jgi:hypothetical protein